MSYRGRGGRWRRGNNVPQDSFPHQQNSGGIAQKNQIEPKKDIKAEPMTPEKPTVPTPVPPPKEPVPTNTGDVEMAQKPTNGDANNQESGEEKTEDKPFWKRKTFVKLPKRVRKKRLNAKLRNILAPRNAIMVLHELHPDLLMTVNEEVTSTGQVNFSVTVEINGKQFKGQGLSKALAKQTACENALKAALLEKMTQQHMMALKVDGDSENETTPKDTVMSDDAPMDTSDGSEGGAKKPRVVPEDDVPWGSLASYAMFRLFSEWQSQGYTFPVKSQPAPAPATPNRAQGCPQPMKKIPADAHLRHPVQLLNQLKPMCKYVETREGMPFDTSYTCSVSFEGHTFQGTGGNKKEAKKVCAKKALAMLGIVNDQ